MLLRRQLDDLSALQIGSSDSESDNNSKSAKPGYMSTFRKVIENDNKQKWTEVSDLDDNCGEQREIVAIEEEPVSVDSMHFDPSLAYPITIVPLPHSPTNGLGGGIIRSATQSSRLSRISNNSK